MIATPHNLGTSSLASLSNLVPSTHSVTSTLSRTSPPTTVGAHTASRPRFLIAASNCTVFRASSL